MSQIKLSPNASGTGVFTIDAPNSNTNRTFSLPDETGTVLTTESTTMPKVPVVQLQGASTTSVHNTWVRFNWDENHGNHVDTASLFNTSNERIVPTLAGYYFFHLQFRLNNIDRIQAAIVKNSTIPTPSNYVSYAENWTSDTGEDDENLLNITTSGVAYMNGTSDYVEFWGMDADVGGRTFANMYGSCFMVSGA